MSARPQVLVTGPIGRAEEYVEAADLAEWTGKSLELIATYPRALDLQSLPESLTAICVTSKQALPALKQLPELYRDVPVAAVGRVTAGRVQELGFSSLGEPAKNAKELAAWIERELPSGANLLWPRGSLSDELAVQLRGAGFHVSDPVVYETLPSPESVKARDLSGLDAIFFASPSAVRVFAELPHRAESVGQLSAVAIGSTTREALREADLGFARVLTLSEPTPAEFAILLAGITRPH